MVQPTPWRLERPYDPDDRADALRRRFTDSHPPVENAGLTFGWLDLVMAVVATAMVTSLATAVALAVWPQSNPIKMPALAGQAETHSSREWLATQSGSERLVTKTSRALPHIRDCNHAWALGLAPIHKGEHGYRPSLDGDHDGIACEPIYRRR